MRTSPLLVGFVVSALAAGCSDKPKSVSAVEKLGGHVQLDGQTVVEVNLLNAKVSDEQLAELAAQPELQGIMELDLAGTQVTDQGLRVLKAFPNLQRLNLGGDASHRRVPH
jgi:hypothetical protein